MTVYFLLGTLFKVMATGLFGSPNVILVKFNFSSKDKAPALYANLLLEQISPLLSRRLRLEAECLSLNLGSHGSRRARHFLSQPRQALVTKPAEAPFPSPVVLTNTIPVSHPSRHRQSRVSQPLRWV